jgi:hypothetical protein
MIVTITPQECLARAAKWRRLADDVANYDFRDVLLLMAARWESVAEKKEAAASTNKAANMNGKSSAGRWVLRH